MSAPACTKDHHVGPFLRTDVYEAAGWVGIGDCANCGSTVAVPDVMVRFAFVGDGELATVE